MTQNYDHERQVAVSAVRESAKLCRAVQQQITPAVLQKKDRSPVTVADFGSQALVCRALHEAFADDPVIAEEDSHELREPANAELLARVAQRVSDVQPGTDADTACQWIDHGGAQEFGPRFWTLDPIDGTKGFLRKEQYAISLALVVEGELTVAALGCPNLAMGNGVIGALFTAVRGQGAFVQPLEDDAAVPQAVRVSATADPSAARLCESVESGHTSHGRSQQIAERLGITAESVRLDSQAKYAVVARGEADVYLRLPTKADYVEKIWDHAGGALCVTEAGGTVTDITGKPLNFTHGWGLKTNQGVIVTNGHLHAQVLDAVRHTLG
jgi:HAL2 family 3'(2'),5'-bisphosphate nucleotidase